MSGPTSPIFLGDLFAVPKAHLHVHLESSARAALVRLWCEEASLPEPDIRRWNSLPSFLAEIEKVKAAIPTPDAMREAARIFVHDEAADGVVWTEPQLYPYVLGARGEPAALVDAVLDGLRRGATETGIGAGLILAINYTKPPAEALRIAQLAVERASAGVVGLGLCNDETAAPASTFLEAFTLVRDTPLLRVPHAGEARGPESVRDAMTLDPHRIMHGVRAQEDPDLFRRLVDADITLDTAPTSNVELGVVPDLERFPARAMLDAGVSFSVSADSVLMMRSSATLELARVAAAHQLTRAEVASIAESSLLASAAPRDLVDEQLNAIAQWATGV
jgi:adenosine deaminase